MTAIDDTEPEREEHRPHLTDSPALPSRWRALALLAAGTLIGLGAVLAFVIFSEPPKRVALELDPNSGWQEVGWPFLIDPWWPSKALHCGPSRCGGDTVVYLRAKAGFCNCATGISTDQELERVGDFRIIARAFSPAGPGHAVTVQSLRGRSRAYQITAAGPSAQRRSARIIGLHSGCDALVATAVYDHDQSAAVELAVLALLGMPGVKTWTHAMLKR